MIGKSLPKSLQQKRFYANKYCISFETCFHSGNEKHFVSIFQWSFSSRNFEMKLKISVFAQKAYVEPNIKWKCLSWGKNNIKWLILKTSSSRNHSWRKKNKNFWCKQKFFRCFTLASRNRRAASKYHSRCEELKPTELDISLKIC